MQARWVALIIIYRIANAISCQTFFQPDEFFQSLEIAHRFVFGYGYQTWEWRPHPGPIRSPIVPLMFVPVYRLLQMTGLDDTACLIYAPKVLQGVIASLIDMYTFKLALSVSTPAVAKTALACSLISVFNAVVSIRTFSNSIETALTAIALSYWPFHAASFSLSKFAVSLMAAAVACVIRPTNVFVWLFLGSKLLLHRRYTLKKVFTASVIGASMLIVSTVVDATFFDTATCTACNFYKQNVTNKISLFYGISSWHYYVFQGIPLLCWTLLPFVVMGVRQDAKTRDVIQDQIVGCVSFVILIFSCLPHKEVRFVQPLLPMLHVMAGRGLHRWGQRQQRRPVWPAFFALLCFLFPTVYMLRYHASGQIKVMSYLRQQDDVFSVGFLMPCHSTPWQSHLHNRRLAESPSFNGETGRLWSLTCEPPILGQDAETYMDQSDFFYADPVSYLRDRFPVRVNASFPPSPPSPVPVGSVDSDLGWKHEWPSHIIMFEDLLDRASSRDGDGQSVRTMLQTLGYVETLRLWNSYWHDDPRRRGHVLVWQWQV